MASLPQVGLEAIIAGLPGFNAGAAAITKAYDEIERKGHNVAKASNVLSSSLSSLAGPFVNIGQSVLNFGAIAGGAALVGVGALTAGIVALGGVALQETAKYERMSLSITNLVAREISQGQIVEQQKQVLAGLTAKETEELEKLKGGLDNEANQRDILTARIQEQKQRIIDLTAQYGENGLVVIKERAELQGMELDLADLNQEVVDHQNRIKELDNKEGQLITTMEKVRVGQMSMSDAMTQAGPRAQELLKWIQMLAIQSPFTQEGIAEAFRTALAYGFTTEKAQRLTTAMVDFTSATGKSEQSAGLIALALGQIQARGKLSAQELRQLSEQGVGVNKILEDMGFTLDDVTNGLVGTDEFIEAVIKDMEVFKGSAKEQSTTLAGLMASLSDLKSIALREFFTSTFNAIRPYATEFVNWLTNAAVQTGQIKKLGETLGQYVGNALKNIGTFIAAIKAGGLAVFSKYLGAEGIPLWYELKELIANISTSLSGLGAFFTNNLSGPMTDFTTNIIPMITQGLAFINEHFEEFKGALGGIGLVLGAGVFAAIVAGILSLITPITVIIGAAALLGAAWAGNWGGIQEKTFAAWAVIQPILAQMVDWLSINIPIAIQATTDFWNNTLYPALVTVGTWISTVLIPTLINVGTWLQTNIPIAIQTTSDFWNNILYPSMVTVGTWISGTLIPTLVNLWNLFTQVTGLDTVSSKFSFWLSVITSVSDFISTNLTPLMFAMNDFFSAVFNKTIQAAAGLWQNVLHPALQKVGDIIYNVLKPGLESTGETVEKKVIPPVDEFTTVWLPALTKALETVTKWIKDATGFFKGMADAVNNFTLPPVLTPGSPTPFELALLGIANAADLAGISMANLNNLSMPGMFDKLFKINRGITDFNLLVRKAKDGITNWGKANFIGSEKSANAIRFFTDQFKSNFSAIMGAQNPMQAWMDIINSRNWRKIQLSGGDAREMGQMFFNNFFKEAGKAASQLQDMIISGSQTALQMATTLNQFSSQQAEYLKSQVENLQDFIASGETSLDFNGNIINATEAQEILNQKLQEQKDIQDDILKIKEQESKLKFLEDQLSLIKMVKDAGLNVKDILGNITFGLNASIPDMMTATNNVIQAIINQVDQDLGNITQIGASIGNSLTSGVTSALGIASPSKVMQFLAKQTMAGFTGEIISQIPKLASTIDNVISVPIGQMMGGNTTNNTNYNFSMNVNSTASPQAVVQQFQVMRAMT